MKKEWTARDLDVIGRAEMFPAGNTRERRSRRWRYARRAYFASGQHRAWTRVHTATLILPLPEGQP